MPRRKLIPSQPRLHNGSGQAYVRLDGRMIYLGRFGTPEAEAAFKRTVAEWLSTGIVPNRKPAEDDGITVVELCVIFMRWAEGYYVKDDKPTGEQDYLRRAIRPLIELYGDAPAASFTTTNLRAVRQTLIDRKLARTHINGICARIRRIFKWGASRDRVPPAVFQALQAVEGLRRGRSGARETEPVRPAPDAHVDAIRPFVSSVVWGMVELQRLTGMRSGEVTIMRGADIDTNGAVWAYRPSTHKTEHHGFERIIDLGPRAQEIVRPLLRADLSAYLFDPRQAEAERYAKAENHRRPNQVPNKRKGARRLQDHYSVSSYRRAIDYACRKANVPSWSPHQLRHSFATRIRKLAGVEVARAALGHQHLRTTEIYSEIDRGKVQELAARAG